MKPWHSQDRHVVRLDWGPVAAEALTTYAVAAGSPVCAVVVDVLSFPTCVSLALVAGAEVVAASLRNRSAVAHWLVDWLEASRGSRTQPAVVVVPAGERWPEGS